MKPAATETETVLELLKKARTILEQSGNANIRKAAGHLLECIHLIRRT